MKQPRGAAGNDLFFFIFFLIVLGIIWTLTGGPDRAISRSGPFLSPPFPLGSETGYSVGNFEIPGVTIPSAQNSGSGISDREDDSRNALQNLLSRIRLGFGELNEEASPYAGSVSLSAGRAKASDADKEYVIISFARDADRTVLANWKLESTVSYVHVPLPGAAYLPSSGSVNTESTIAADPGTKLYVASGRSPIGSSFRVNTCTGYFEQFQDFEPSLPQTCPAPEDELADRVSSGFVPNDTCIDFVEDIDRCTLTLTEIPPGVGGQCQSFILETLSYSGCIAAHKDTPGFYKDEWRLFLNRDQELWRNSRERIRLLDENDKVIDAVSF